MKKYASVVAICLVALMVTLAFAAAIKVDLLAYPGTGYGSGQAILNYAKGADKTEIQVNCWGLDPGEWYTVRIGPLTPRWKSLGTFTAKKNGEGHIHARLSGDWSSNYIAVNLQDTKTTILMDERY